MGLDDIRWRCGNADPLEWAHNYTKVLTDKDNAEPIAVTVSLRPRLQMVMTEQKVFNGIYLAPSKVYLQLGPHKIYDVIYARYGFEYDLYNIIPSMIYTRVLKLSSFAESHQPRFKLEEIFRSLLVLAKENNYI